jgi:hypothetical protein
MGQYKWLDLSIKKAAEKDPAANCEIVGLFFK